MRNILHLALPVLLVAAVLSCARSHYVRPDEVTEWDASYTDTDLRLLTEEMVMSLSGADLPPTESGRPVLAFLRIGNRTSQHIDTEGIADKIMVALVRIGRFDVVDRKVLEQQARELALVDLQRVDVEGAVRLGGVIGADHFLVGDLYSIEKAKPSRELKYYNLTMRLVDVRTSRILWAEEKELKKVGERSWFD
ncbi:MAG: CsgG/HfaB family protein [bacterium]